MDVLKVKLHQHTAVYRNPITSEVIESYPLPPPSTVIGFLHSLLRKLEPDPKSMNISIQGDYAALLRDYQWYKKYDDKMKGFGSRPYPILVHTLYDVRLLLHFFFSDRQFGEEVARLIHNPPYFPYIGRAEDLVKVEDVKWVECGIEMNENGFLKRAAYISEKDSSRLSLRGVPYNLAGYYRYVPVKAGKETKVLRDFDWVNVQYIEQDAYFEAEDSAAIWKDEQGDFVWWCLPNPIPETTQRH